MKPKKPIETLILNVRKQKVILDADLAELYGIPTYRFNEAFKRNRQRFPDDFAFQLTAKEFAGLRSQMTAVNSSQIAMSSSQAVESEGSVPNWSQFVTSSKRHRGAAYRPWAFTEHGAIMAARPRIPKGFRPSAQGCEERATLGCETQSLWDWPVSAALPISQP